MGDLLDLSPGQRVLLRDALLAMHEDGSFDALKPDVRGLLAEVAFFRGDEHVIADARSRADWAEEVQRVQRKALDRVEAIADRIFVETCGAAKRPYNRFGNPVRDHAHDLDAIEAALVTPSSIVRS